MRCLYFLTAIVVAFWTSPVLAQDWCGQAKTPTEIAICANVELGARDNHLTELYPLIREGIGKKPQIIALQRAWLKRRSLCGNDAACILKTYDEIIEVYRKAGAGAGLALPATDYLQASSNVPADAVTAGSNVRSKTISIGEINIDYGDVSATGNSMDALIVANAEYADIPDLQTPVPDSELVSSALKLRGIASVVKTNSTRSELDATLDQFRESPRKDVFIFYYAGHAADINGKSSLLFPAFKVDGNSSNREYEPISEMVGKISKLGYKKVLIVFDACRNVVELDDEIAIVPGATAPSQGDNNPKLYRNLGDRDVNLNALRGLDYAISFSASEGQFAIDSINGKNSPFAEAFAQNLREKPTFFDAIIETRRVVKRSTDGKQHPTLEMSWDEDVSLTSTAIKTAKISFHEPVVFKEIKQTPDIKYDRTQYTGDAVYSVNRTYAADDVCKNYDGLSGSDEFHYYNQLNCIQAYYKLKAPNGAADSTFLTTSFERDSITQVCANADFVTDIDNDGDVEKIGFGSNRYGGYISFERSGHRAEFYSTLGCNFSNIRLYDVDGKGIRDLIIEYESGGETTLVVLSGEKLAMNRDGTFHGSPDVDNLMAQHVPKNEYLGVLGGLAEVAIFYDARLKYVAEIFDNKINYAAFDGSFLGKENMIQDKQAVFLKDGSVDLSASEFKAKLRNFGTKDFRLELIQ